MAAAAAGFDTYRSPAYMNVESRVVGPAGGEKLCAGAVRSSTTAAVTATILGRSTGSWLRPDVTQLTVSFFRLPGRQHGDRLRFHTPGPGHRDPQSASAAELAAHCVSM